MANSKIKTVQRKKDSNGQAYIGRKTMRSPTHINKRINHRSAKWPRRFLS